jgi:DNA repair protein RadD
MFELRQYQRDALDVLDEYWRGGGGNPLLALATSCGKSLLIAWLIRDLLTRYPSLRILVLVHIQELIRQNVKHLLALWPDAPLGINCAAFDQRDVDQQIIFASIQSVFRSPEALGRRDLVIVDECHLVPPSDDSTYRTLLDALREPGPDMRVCGFTATPFRLDSGRLDKGDNRVFDETIFDYGIGQGIAEGWLSPLSSKATDTVIDVSTVGRRGGEFIQHELEAAADDQTVIDGACDEIVTLGGDRKAWLIFCTGIMHATHVRDALRARGISCETVLGITPQDERERIIAAFRAGEIKAIVNVMVLTTGFDVPHIDLLVMLRPTLSTGLYVQMIGRGTRKADGKRDCLVLDFARNVFRHGPVDRISIGDGNGKDNDEVAVKPDTVRAKICPDCQEINSLTTFTCISCGYEWERPAPVAKHARTADAAPILSGALEWLPVHDVRFIKHVKYSDPDAPPTLRVEYLSGLSAYSDYIALQHYGYARRFAERFWFAMGGAMPAPATIDQAMERELDPTLAITVIRGGKYWRVIERRVQRPNGAIVEIDRNYMCWQVNSRAEAFAALKQQPFNDEVPY